jgi:hypothetical protein
MMDTTHRKNKILSVLEWHAGSFKLLVGIASLGLATAILAMSNKGRSGYQNPDASLRLIPIILANAFIFFLFSKRSQRNAERR